MFNMPEIQDIKLKDDAETIAQELYNATLDYHHQLDADHEVGLMLASFGQAITVNITGIGHVGTNLIKFIGFLDNGNPVELLQHVNQINFLLISVKKVNPEEPKKKIGFISQ
ncbi:hypothetical protein EDM56_11425 [Brevibacillus fluminis]|uniref:Uncharacterized protein n=1 Tax=Brevibacillus fluminis TaxID=511487 RepID=A0A3M8DNU3_9BACL|nr:DUF6173 family protein [Brevibacillus fluminis]RNB89770.1 hypothetical protein EDM56_11425 [Brevibacillus fluminis]